MIPTYIPSSSHLLSLTPDNFLPPSLSSRILLSPKEIISLTGLPKTTIYNLISSGCLPAFKIGRHWMIHRNDLYTYLSSCIDTYIDV